MSTTILYLPWPAVQHHSHELTLMTWHDGRAPHSRETRRRPEGAPVFKKPDAPPVDAAGRKARTPPIRSRAADRGTRFRTKPPAIVFPARSEET